MMMSFCTSRTLHALCAGIALAVLTPSMASAQSAPAGASGAQPPAFSPPTAVTPASGASASGLSTQPPAATGRSTPASVPDNFRNIRLGMTLDQVKSALLKDPYFDYKGPPDVSMLASPDENLIETTGYSFISRAFFQFYDKKLYIMILMLNPREISYYTMYTTLKDKYGPSTSLSPDEVVWESPRFRLSLERPLSVKYIDRTVFNRLKEAGKMKQSERSISREAFLNQF